MKKKQEAVVDDGVKMHLVCPNLQEKTRLWRDSRMMDSTHSIRYSNRLLLTKNGFNVTNVRSETTFSTFTQRNLLVI